MKAECIWSSCCAVRPGPEIIAHRGESFDAPENTLAAFRLCWERQGTATELDVQLSQDGRLMVCHDPDTERVAGKKLVIRESTTETLLELDVGAWKDARWIGERIPTLDEALAIVPVNARCLIEIKDGPEALSALVKVVQAAGKRPAQLAIISFHASTIAEAKRQLPELDAYFAAKFEQDQATGAWTPSVDELIQQAKSLRADGLDLACEGPLDPLAVQRIKAAGLQCYVWTVDDPAVAKQFATWGVNGITTNRAAWLRQELALESLLSPSSRNKSSE